MTSQTDNEAVELSAGTGGECFSCRQMVRPVPAGGDPFGDPCIRFLPGGATLRQAKHQWMRSNGKITADFAVVDQLEFARQAAIADAITASA